MGDQPARTPPTPEEERKSQRELARVVTGGAVLILALLAISSIEPVFFPKRYAAERAAAEAKQEADDIAIEAKVKAGEADVEAKRKADKAAAAARDPLGELDKDIDRKYAPKWAVVATLRDPDSAKFGAVYVFPDSDGTEHACGSVNSKNGFGGYVGMTKFIAAPSLAVLDDGSRTFRAAWFAQCSDTSKAIEAMY
jgi:hypothetical protein